MTDGEKMIWAAAFVSALERGDVGHASGMAQVAVERARRKLQFWRERGTVGSDVVMLAEMVESKS